MRSGVDFEDESTREEYSGRGRRVILLDRLSALFHPASSLTVAAQRQFSDYTRRCTFAYRAYNHTRSRTCSCPGRSHIRF